MLKNMLRILTVPDVFLIVIIIAITISMSVTVFRNNGSESIFIYKGTNLFGTYSLNVDRVIEIDVHNTVEIKNAKYRMIKADCPDKRCVKQGFAGKLPIVCLPNQVVVELKANSQAKSQMILH
ncbi:MAG: hypothetical protein CVU48_07170 [Candidatus Cloacimonetes bacterium HGW-Cloacimonetes-1]|nr:MAG: hypothetical protein CVU48_07170 [Candidatus Cloacimonetes bacterium HGW-Cloacimonetes-1]